MICQKVDFGNGVRGFVCSSGKRKRCKCGRAANLLCDWKVPERKSGTCDEPICERCSTSPAPGKDLCSNHAKEFERWKEQRGNR